MRFEKVLELMRGGAKVRRRSWTNTKFIKRFDSLNDDGKLTGETEFWAELEGSNGLICNWAPNAESLFADDWEIVEPVVLELDVVKSQRADKSLIFRCSRNFELTDGNLNAIDSAVNDAIVKIVSEGNLDIF